MLEILLSFIDCDFHLDQTNRGETIFEAWYYTSDCLNTIDFLHNAVRKNDRISSNKLSCLSAAAVPAAATESLNRNEINYPEVLIDEKNVILLLVFPNACFIFCFVNLLKIISSI